MACRFLPRYRARQSAASPLRLSRSSEPNMLPCGPSSGNCSGSRFGGFELLGALFCTLAFVQLLLDRTQLHPCLWDYRRQVIVRMAPTPHPLDIGSRDQVQEQTADCGLPQFLSEGTPEY